MHCGKCSSGGYTRVFLLDALVGEQKVCEMLGDLIWEELSENIIQDCLVHSIPAKSSQLDKYSEVRRWGIDLTVTVTLEH